MNMGKQTSEHETPPTPRQQQVIRIPLPDNEWVEMQLPVPLSESDWQQMETVLKAMKPGLVEPPALWERSDEPSEPQAAFVLRLIGPDGPLRAVWGS